MELKAKALVDYLNYNTDFEKKLVDLNDDFKYTFVNIVNKNQIFINTKTGIIKVLNSKGFKIEETKELSIEKL